MELLHRLRSWGVNPLTQSVFAEGDIARRQYGPCCATPPIRMGSARLQKDRNSEMTAHQHRPPPAPDFISPRGSAWAFTA